MDAGNLNCPMCGAPSSTDSPKCLHCGTRLATISCPSCFGMLFEGSKFCPHCGKQCERAAIGTTAMPCPRCKDKSLDAVSIGQTQVCECALCHGLWVDVATFETICTDRERQSIVLGTASAAFTPGRRPLEAKIQYLRCPFCAELMHRVNFAKCSGVVIDVCKTHGSWFDRDELQHIVEFIRTGGLDLARAKEKNELDQARRRLEARSAPPTGWQPANHSSPRPFCEHDLFDIAGSVISFLLKKD